ncbi:hypothetical protein MS5N3_37310 [Marinobacter salsuginis]|jgi:hypothetical protein|uniref:Uncharacterized protein n=1 Tax=Marinobacter salsuginis TaxID=418719 RepID=A0A5M3PTN6_9GAMM|nr:hypothetical protein MS5N3_37310 [Marinobacter salsuginis]|tara:strand:+ start:186 stop:437 length:252 start_codon:yes stop_codon:yes gene_type:complete
MTVNYLAKAKTDLRAIADGDGIDWEAAGEKVVPVSMIDEDGQTVFTAQITMNVRGVFIHKLKPDGHGPECIRNIINKSLRIWY